MVLRLSPGHAPAMFFPSDDIHQMPSNSTWCLEVNKHASSALLPSAVPTPGVWELLGMEVT